ncbi:NAD(P)H-binding protein [Frankia sp. AgB1.9]|uniref:NAD(P)H-binding protein n=1 Tax=unclassified Frankia TaxID=2632575 RepID=UPI001933CDFF|nr:MULTISPECIES: NAD(P)H-binding protein [unclassified Frankia]MBL7492933.1 NAD(P)H-binding protein [Frankia sp. AgW1.1]MBL7550539.1 NAD(P)H-binding protein [Frankia sp. AgB1.9]MBL7624945.1 NAD(P)H-binding protein [Frankia sp. AgB1.8]
MVTVVFGPGGNVGRHVAASLTSAGVPVRLVSRNPEQATLPARADVVRADLDQPETLPGALDGARNVFLYARPARIDDFVAAAESAGVRHVVLLSSAAVLNGDPMSSPIAAMHAVVESALKKSSLAWTFLRPGMFATNALAWWRDSIREEGVTRLPYPEARTAPVHEKDIAALAVTALTSPGHLGHSYLALGPESLSLRRQVRLIGEAVGRDITVEVTTVDQARAELSRTLPPIAVEGVLAGWQAGTTAPPQLDTTIEQVTGRPAHTFARWAHDHASDFR